MFLDAPKDPELRLGSAVDKICGNSDESKEQSEGCVGAGYKDVNFKAPCNEEHADDEHHGCNEEPQGSRSHSTEPDSLPETVLEELLRARMIGQVVLSNNFRDEPFIECTIPALPKLRTPVRSEKLVAWLSRYCHQVFKTLIGPGDTRAVILALAGYAIGTPQKNPQEQEITKLLDSDPLFNVVMEFVESLPNDSWIKSPTEAYEEIRTYARQSDLLKLGAAKFPASPNAFSRKLGDLQLPFRAVGIRVIREKIQQQRFIKFERFSVPSDSVSAESQGQATSTAMILQPTSLDSQIDSLTDQLDNLPPSETSK